MDISLNSSPVIDLQAPLMAYQSKIVEEFATSERSDHRAMAAILTIERECAEADLAKGPHACGGTAPPEGAPPPDTRPAADPMKGQAPHNQALRMWKRGKRIAQEARRDKPLNLSGKPWRVLKAPAPVKLKRTPRAAPFKRATRTTRARAVHSNASHGGSRRVNSDSGGDGSGGGSEPPPPPYDDDDDCGGPHIPITWENGIPMVRGKPMFAPVAKPKPGHAFVNVNCECWRRQFPELFCNNCLPVRRIEVPISKIGTTL